MRADVKKAGDLLRNELKRRTLPPNPITGLGGLGLSEFDIAKIILDVQKADLDAIVEKFSDEHLQQIHDCCGCSKPWELYEQLIAAIKALSAPADSVDPSTTTAQESPVSHENITHSTVVETEDVPRTTYSKTGFASLVVLCTDEQVETAIEEVDAAVAAVKEALNQRIAQRDAR